MPLGIVTLEAMGLLLEILGEVSPELALEVEKPVLSKLVAKQGVLRSEVHDTFPLSQSFECVEFQTWEWPLYVMRFGGL